ncbi:DUF2065 domain-containing protein [Granulosicoccaceae sp. 1_MG-2023]|nr:DUF2065 domain-containing protein [Granulosicoccaceae sp. 1_MG-2023]
MSEILTAFALVFVIEGLLLAAAPSAMKRMLLDMQRLSVASLRTAGLLSMLAGLILILVIK